MRTIALFNNKGGVGKTSLVYHLAWMFADQGIKTLAVDLDPQANLTAMFLNEEQLETLCPDAEHPNTIYGAINPILRGMGDIARPEIQRINANLGLIAGDLGLSRFEDMLSDAWPRCHNQDESAFRAISAFHRIIQQYAEKDTDLILLDMGPNLGPINRAALIATDHVCLPLAPDLFLLHGLKNLGAALRDWRMSWTELLTKAPSDLSMPQGTMDPIGYIVMQVNVFRSQPLKVYERWMARLPYVYRESILGNTIDAVPSIDKDPYCLSQLKHYRSMMPMAMEAHKPIFKLRPADGAMGAHAEAVLNCYRDFKKLAHNIARASGIAFPV